MTDQNVKNDTPSADAGTPKPRVVRRQIYFLRHAQSANNAASHDDKRAAAEGDKSAEAPVSEQQSGGPTPSEPSRKKRRMPDPPLTEQGVNQAEAAAAHFLEQANYKVGLIWCSAMTRCVQTTLPFVKAFKAPVRIITDLHEEGGLFEGARADQGKKSTNPLVHGLLKDEIINMFPADTVAEFVPSYQKASPIDNNGEEEATEEIGWWRGGFESVESVKQRCEDVTNALFEEVRNPTADPESSIFIVSHGLFIDRLFKHLLQIPFDAKSFLLTENAGLTSIQIECEVGSTGWDGTRVALVFHNRSGQVPKDLRTGHSCAGFLMAEADL